MKRRVLAEMVYVKPRLVEIDSERLSKMSLVERALYFVGSDSDKFTDSFRGRFISKRQIKNLENLEDGEELERQIAILEEVARYMELPGFNANSRRIEEFINNPQTILEFNKNLGVPPKDPASTAALLTSFFASTIFSIYADFHNALDHKDLVRRIEFSSENADRVIDRVMGKDVFAAMHTNEFMREENSSRGYSDPEGFFDFCSRALEFKHIDLFFETLESKGLRIRALEKIDSVLAYAYGSFTPALHYFSPIFNRNNPLKDCEVKPASERKHPETIMQFLNGIRNENPNPIRLEDVVSVKFPIIGNCASYSRADRELFLAFVSYVKSYGSTKLPEYDFKVEAVPRVLVQPIVKQYDLAHSIKGKWNGEVYTEDNLARIDYFVEDLRHYGFDDDKLREVGRAFSHFGLGNRLHAGQKLSDLQFRNFFDDIMLNEVIKGKVPSSSDLETHYERNI